MPLYEYECDACYHRFELIRKFSDPPVETCPACGGVVRKLLSSPAIQFKGSGWYITDYARAGKSDAGAKSAGSDASAASEKKGDGASDTKAESKSENTSEKGDKGDSKAETKSAAAPKPSSPSS